MNAILAAAKQSMATGQVYLLFNVNRGAIGRVFGKFSNSLLALKHGAGVPFIDWGVLQHPKLNGGEPFTLRVVRQGACIHVEASPGEAWWLLTDKVWLDRRGATSDLQVSLSIKAEASDPEKAFNDPNNVAIALLILKLANQEVDAELPSLTYDRISDFAFEHKLGADWSAGYRHLRFFVCIDGHEFIVEATNMDATKEGDGGVRISAKRLRTNTSAS
ncbi:hypothetical protein [Inhella sp.]|uniref:hypothetical protein n=1 Tax=Inhella sp. TaxID=1921806 RepID=UPI0035AE0E4A